MTDRGPSRIEQMTTYIWAWRAEYEKLMTTAEAFGTVERPATILPVARMWWETGLPVTEAVEWFAAGIAPADAVKLSAAGATPTSAKEAELAAMDATDGGSRLADWRELRQTLADASTTAEMDPDNPGVVTLGTAPTATARPARIGFYCRSCYRFSTERWPEGLCDDCR